MPFLEKKSRFMLTDRHCVRCAWAFGFSHLGLAFPPISMPWTAAVKELRYCSWYQTLLVAVSSFLFLLLTQGDKGFMLLSKVLTKCAAQSIALISNAELFYRSDVNEHDKIRAQTQFHVTLSTLPFCCSGRGRQRQEYQQLCYSLLSQEVIPLLLYNHNVYHSKSIEVNLFFLLLYLWWE